MLKGWIFLLLGIAFSNTYGQKRALDSALLRGDLEWTTPSQGSLSVDGRYAAYMVGRQPVDEKEMVVTATDGSWEQSFLGIEQFFFSEDNRWLFVLSSGDSLWRFSLESHKKELLAQVRSAESWNSGLGRVLTYLREDSVLVICREDGLVWQRFASVQGYFLGPTGRSLVLQRGLDITGEVQLYWADWPSGNLHPMWRGRPTGSIAFDSSGEQVAFMTMEPDSLQRQAIWYYRRGAAEAVREVNDHTGGIDSSLSLDEACLQFSADGDRLFFQLREHPVPPVPKGAASVDVWNYKDLSLQSMQVTQRDVTNVYAAVKRIGAGEVIRLQYPSERMVWGHGGADDQALVYPLLGDYECWWNPKERSAVYHLSTRSGVRQQIYGGSRVWPTSNNFVFAPDGRRLIWFNHTNLRWYYYNPQSRHNTVLGEGIRYALYDSADILQQTRYHAFASFPPAGWVAGGGQVLLYDYYDIWRVDIAGTEPPRCLTRGYGRRHGIRLRIAGVNPEVTEIDLQDTLILSSFDPQSKDNGFYRLMPGKGIDPELLFKGPVLLYAAPSQLLPMALGASYVLSTYFLKAQKNNAWLLCQQSATQAPNYVFTRDFRAFHPISHCQPQQDYGWLTTELVHWRKQDGTPGTGILYKPEKFDSHRKYPIIFHYYEQLSDDLHNFPEPYLNSADINVPYFVSHGYLVFAPDITYRVGHTGESVVNSVVSAARHLAKLPYVDGRHMGLSGHSFGGFETNFLITHSHLFAAAAEAAGVSDLISAYGGMMFGFNGAGKSEQFFYEIGQGRIGATLWDRPDLYLKNSPIFQADRVTTPLLMMNNHQDGLVSFAQAVELFTALRRLQKPVWLLQYDLGQHVILEPAEQGDYSIRMTQFFDHYLKGAPAPIWMTQGIPARWKGLRSGFELDVSGKP